MERIEQIGLEPAPVNTARGSVVDADTRNNDRVIFDQPALARLLFDRVREALVPAIEEWRLCGLNERFRAYRYRPGQHFAPHQDGAWHRSDDERSLFTFMVYLNDDFTGGETVFFRPSFTVRPRTGRALLFFHPLLHEGAEVRTGTKYALRSDVMYRRG